VRLLAVLGTATLVLSAFSTSGSSGGDPEDGDLSRLASVDIVVRAEVVEVLGPPKDNPYIMVVSAVPSVVLWSSGSRFTPSGEKSTVLPEEMGKLESFNVWVPHELEIGKSYAFFASQSNVEQKDLVPGDWTSRFEVEIGEDRLADGTSAIARNQAASVVASSGLSLLDSLIALTEEQVTGLSDHWATDIETAGSEPQNRASWGPLSAVAFGNLPMEQSDVVLTEFNTIPWALRQLPTNDDERSAIKNAGKIDFEWEWWELAVEYDDRTLEEFAWVGIQFDDVGVIGPVFPDPADRIVPVFGWGPQGHTPKIVFWPTFGLLRTGPPESEADVVDQKVVGPELAPKSSVMWDEDGALLVRLEGPDLARVEPIGAQALAKLVARLTAPADGTSELSEHVAVSSTTIHQESLSDGFSDCCCRCNRT